MSLRARLIVAYLAVVVVLGTALVVVARTQHDHLVDQLDRQLTAARPFLEPGRFTPSRGKAPAVTMRVRRGDAAMNDGCLIRSIPRTTHPLFPSPALDPPLLVI